MKKILLFIALSSFLAVGVANAGNYSQAGCTNSSTDNDGAITTYACVTDAYQGDCWCDVDGECATQLSPAGAECGNSSYICGTQKTLSDIYGDNGCGLTAQNYNYGA